MGEGQQEASAGGDISAAASQKEGPDEGNAASWWLCH